ncbi:MAG: response regulator transcription factor [Anaerolineae bacterium]|nr:response regulator transcription factor [Anaerolineae bacterium]
MSSIRVFLADDHAVVRDGLRFLLQAQPDIQVVGDAADGRDALQQITQLMPDVAVLDIAMSLLNGIEVAERIRLAGLPTQVIILSMHSTSEHIFRALRAGVRSYLLKESAGIEVAQAVRAVYAGQRYLSHKISEQVVDGYVQTYDLSPDEVVLSQLSSRERETLQLIIEGKTSAEIAQLLTLSPKTVDTYRSRLMAKLGIDNVPDLVRFAIRHGLASL